MDPSKANANRRKSKFAQKRASTIFGAKGAKGAKSTIKKPLKQSPTPDQLGEENDDEVIKSMSTMEEEEIYDQKLINEFMAQESLPEDDVLVFNFNALLQTKIFGPQTVTRLNEKIADMQAHPTDLLTSEGSVAESVQMSEQGIPQSFAEVPVYVGLNLEREAFLKSLEQSDSTDALVAAVKEKVTEYPGEYVTFIVDRSMKFGGNFLMILSQEVDNKLRLEGLEVQERDVVVDVIEEADDEVTWVYPNFDQPWISMGSEFEILEAGYTESRPRTVTKFQRPRREFEAKRPLDTHSDGVQYTEVKPFEDKSFEIPILELERGVACTNIACDHFTNTEWRYPRNQVVQYEPRLGEDEKEISISTSKTQKLMTGVSNLLPLFEQGLKENLMFNFLVDDFANLAASDDTFDNKSANTFKEVVSFSDLKFSKHKAVSHVEWHPTIEGLVAVSGVERLAYEERVNQQSRVLMTESTIIVWSFFEPIQPQLIMLAPEDILCFQFNPTTPNIVAGGCFNGEVVLWDIAKHDLSNVLEKTKHHQKVPLIQFDETDSQKVPVMPWCAASNIEASHATPITYLQWLPDHLELNRAGMPFENFQRKCIQLMTCAADSGILLWDLRPDKSPLAVDKTRDQMVIPRDVPPTFNAIDAKWKPFLHINVFRPENAPDHCPTCFCIRERQGDRSVLELKSNVKKRIDSENDPNRIGLPKAQPLDGINTNVFVGTEDGDIVYVDWVPQKDVKTAKRQTTLPSFVAQHHDGPISYIARSPFLPEVVLCVGGFSWSLWKEGITSGALLCSAPYVKAVTGGLWSPTRPSVFYIIRCDGVLESWDLLDKTHEPALMQSVSASSLTALSSKVEGKKHYLAVGDMHGTLKVLLVPHRLKFCGANELEAVTNYIDREVQRRAFVVSRWSKREHERISTENEKKRLAGIATAAELSEEEKLQKLRVEYEAYLSDERQFLRSLGLVDDIDDLPPKEDESKPIET
uniref:WD_REPEATS_REGION domain-containing protein n=2 Tax=Mesocestoides corti TaxID=53468 RepID=A0A5K3FCF1_MESCO